MPKFEPTKKESILIPESLSVCKYNKEATILFWWLIDTWIPDDDSFATIHDEHFRKINGANDTRADVRQYLEENAYIEIQKTIAKDGTTKNLRKPRLQSQRYRTLEGEEELVPYFVESAKLESIWPCATQNDELCLLTRRNHGLLERKPEKKPLLAEKKRGVRIDLHSIRTLELNKGNIHKGKKVNRIFSPWARASKRIRPCFNLASEEMICLDLRCSQVALLAAYFDDQDLVRDCADDKFYTGLASMLGTHRDDAKQPFFEYYFGTNRTERARNKQALEIQKWMLDKYPKAARLVFEAKSKNHNQLAIDLQNREALIFIDGAYHELGQMGLPALTIHDSIFVPASGVDAARAVIEKHLDRVDGLSTYHLKQELNQQKNKEEHTVPISPTQPIVPSSGETIFGT